MSNELNQIISQAQRQAKKDKIKKFLQHHKKLVTRIAIAALVTVITLAAIAAIQNSRGKKFSEIVHRSLMDQQLGQFDKAQSGLKEVYDSYLVPSGVKSIVMLRYAAFLLNDGKNQDSIRVYQELNNCFFCNEYAKDLAGLLVVKIWMSDNSEITKPGLAERIKKIEKSAEILKNHVAEQRALLEMMNGNLAESHKIFEAIVQDEDVFPALKERANDGLKILVEKGYQSEVSVKNKPEAQPESQK